MMKIDCLNWQDIGLRDAGQCHLGKFRGRPSHGTCMMCLGKPMQPMATPARPPLPAILTPEQMQRVREHRAICESCEQAKGFTRLTVRCDGCGCVGISLINGQCPKNKWPT